MFIYLRDRSSSEVEEIADVPSPSQLAFEWVPADDRYAVEASFVSVFLGEIARVEVFAVDSGERSKEYPRISAAKLRVPGGFVTLESPGKAGKRRV